MITKMKIARRYARIFLTEKMAKDSILTLAAEMQFISDTISADAFIAEFLTSPAISSEKKLGVVRALVRRGQFSHFTLELLETLIRHSREDIIVHVSRRLHFIADDILNRIRVQMYTAAEPSVTEVEGLSRRIGHFFEKNVFVERFVDQSIIGGFVLEGDGKRVDMSIRGQLEKILEK